MSAPTEKPANEAAEAVLRIRRDPVSFVEQVFGETVLGKQTAILAALARPDVREVHVKACHAAGKTHVVSRAVAWFLSAYPQDAIVLTTAPTWPQVEEQIWREIRDGAAKAKVNLGGRLLKASWELGPKWYALGIATSPDTAVNIQGYHAAHVLVIVDEADGVAQAIWNAVDGLATSAHVTVLAIGNPINPNSAWRKRYERAQHDRYAVCIKIAADDVLELTDGGAHPYLLQRWWVEDKKQRWGESSALYIAKVLAEWPDQGADTLIPIAWLERARGREVPMNAGDLLRAYHYPMLERAGLPRIRFHDLRHTAISLMLAQGVPVHVVSVRAGHANPAITLRIYAHVMPSGQREAADALGRLLHG